MIKLFLLIVAIFSHTLIAKETLLPTEKSLIEGTLKNGFKYSIKKNLKPKNRAELRLLVNIGSLEESDEQKGLAHFIEHMAFNGTKHFKKNDLIHYLESIGIKFGVHLNASTSYEKTLYKLTIPLESDNLKKSFLIFQDWAGALNFNPKEFNKERGVILEELRLRENMGFRIYNQSKKLFFKTSKYMERQPIGTEEVIKNISVEEAKEFYNKWYRPEFMHFIAVGDFNTTKVESLVKEYFSTLTNKSTAKRASREIEDRNITNVLSLTDREMTSNSVSLAYVDRIESRRTIKDERKGIIESIMFKLFRLKAKEQILKNNPKATTISFINEIINSKKSFYSFYATYQKGDDKEALKDLYQLIASLKEYGFSKEDFERIKQHKLVQNEEEYRRRNDKYSSSITSQLLLSILYNSIYINSEYRYKLRKKLIATIKLEEVNKVFKKVINFQDRFILFKNTDGTEVSKKEVLKIINSVTPKDLTKVKKLPQTLLKRELKPTKIVSTKKNRETDSFEFKLENGIKVIFKQTNFSKDNVKILAFSFGGDSLYNAKELNNVRKASSFVNKSGAGEFSNIDLSKILLAKNIYLYTSINKFTETIDGFSKNKDIESFFQLLYFRLTNPTINSTVATNKKKILTTRAKEAMRNPKTKFKRELIKWYLQNDPRVFFDTEKSISELNSTKMLKIYKERFADFNNFTFVIVGDINVEKVKDVISKYLGNLPTNKKETDYIDRKTNYIKGEHNFVREYNNDNISNTFLLFNSSLSYTKENSYALKAMISILKIRLREKLREDKSGIYNISINGNISRLEKKHARVLIKFSSDPKREKELVSYIYDEIKKIKKEYVSVKELQTYKKKFHITYETNMRKNSYWINKIIDAYKFKTPIEDIYKIPKIVDNLSQKDIKEIANQIFRENRVEAKLNPKK